LLFSDVGRRCSGLGWVSAGRVGGVGACAVTARAILR
jgi:hypothetical protein